MPSLRLPADFAPEILELLRAWPDAPAVRRFRDLARAGVPWSDRMPRRLAAYADRHGIAVRGRLRLMRLALAGFEGPQRWRLLRDAVAELRQARADIAAGREAKLYMGELRVWGDGGGDAEPYQPSGLLRALLNGGVAAPSPGPPPDTPAAPLPAAPAGRPLTRPFDAYRHR